MRNSQGLRLYKVAVPGDAKYFDNKRAAKIARDRAVEDGHESAVVNRGPDHWRGETGS